MNKHRPRRTLPALAGLLALILSGWVAAEPPSRAARLGYISGTVSFSPAGEPDWVRAMVNRPLTTGDRLWSDVNSRAELQIGGAALRIGATTSVTVLNLDDRITQVQLSQGTLKVRVRHMRPNQTFEVDTPNLAFTLRHPGEYRIDVDANDDATAVMVQSGEGEVYGDGASYTVNSHQGYRFYGTGLSDYDQLGIRRDDDLDRWARERDRRGDNSPSARYVSSEVVGFEDLDANGTWRSDREYGNVWTPSHVAADWTPYRDGHWAWVDPWGWTWVDDAPWGFAVSHYGRWTNLRGSWGWVPGPQREQAVYAPALVAFIGGKNFQMSVSIGGSAAPNVGWFPLAPRDVYQPSYPVSSTYFANINRSNAVIAPTIITQVYNTTNVTNNTVNVTNNTTNVTNVTYVNQQVAGAVVAVPMQAFVQSQQVAKAVVKVSKEALASAPVAHIVAVAPVQQSTHGGSPTVTAAPPSHEHAIVARTAPPPPPVPFAIQQKQLAARPGIPIDEVQRTQLKQTAPSAAAPKVNVVPPAKVPNPTALPPETAPAAKSPEARKVDAAKVVEAAKSGAVRPEVVKGEPGKPDAAKAATVKAEFAKVEADKAEAAKADATKAAAAKAETAKADAARAASGKLDVAAAAAAKAEASKADTAKAEAAKLNAIKAAAAKAEASKAAETRGNADRAKAEQVKVEAARVDAAKVEESRDNAAKAKAEHARDEAAKADAARAANAKAEESKANAARAEQGKAEQARAEATKADAARATNAKAEESRGNAARAEQARAEAAKADAVRNANAKAEESRNNAARAEAAKADAARNANAKAEESRNNAARAEAAHANAPRGAPPQATPGATTPEAHGPGRKPEPDTKSEEERKKKKAEEEAQNR